MVYHGVSWCMMTRHAILHYGMSCYDVLCCAVTCYGQYAQTFYAFRKAIRLDVCVCGHAVICQVMS